ncbi:DUF5895 domain-containing protein [Plectonema radiosum NIES-515]|uniref:DUF5895 domain-containing protein n=1 Tax=Plectonema radiosum NIES-515 TaxID=2986073 RepID=A0ABT3B2I9_9CYAN|nr:DUF5895 domain-containing protein [Plectonema radiosum]MCV3215578.1 DUF5895 domain-containing protein [Plectonema radiosum NIES-515]
MELDQFTLEQFTGTLSSFPSCQILNDKDPKVVGLFIKKDNLDLIGWEGEPATYEHTFSSGTVEMGWHSKSPKMHVLAISPRFIELRETKEIVGNYETPSGFKLYKELGETAALRSFYLIYVLGKNNENLHQVPLVLTIYGVAAARFGKAYQQFKTKMEVAYSKATKKGYRSLNTQFHCLCVFNPTFKPSLEPPDAPKKSWVAIPESVAMPEPTVLSIGKFICMDKSEELWSLAASSTAFTHNINILKAAEEPTVSKSELPPHTVDVDSIPY